MNFDHFEPWEIPPGRVTPQRALELLKAQTAELSGAGAPSRDHQPDDRAYKRRRRELDKILARLGIDPPFPWASLTLWEAEAKTEFPRDYAGRRRHLRALADPVREQLSRRISDEAAGDLQTTVADALALATSATLDPSAIREELRRVENLVYTDPGAAIGKAKNLVEATAKAVLAARGRPHARANVPDLVDRAMKELGLDVASATGHEQTVAELMVLLEQVALKVNRLRNKAGDGHGQATAVVGLDLRHGRLAVRASLAWCAFMLETLHDQSAPTG